MKGGYRIGVVIPARDEEKHIRKVIDTLPDFVDAAIVINDGSTDGTKNILDEYSKSEQIHSIELSGNGVGAAIDAGHQYLLELWSEEEFISVVMAGDGQMNPNDMELLLLPITEGYCEYVKGDRFMHAKGVQDMPSDRRGASPCFVHRDGGGCSAASRDA